MLNLLILLAERFSMIGLLAFILSKANFFKKVISNNVSYKDLSILIIIFSLIGIIGTYVGIPINGAIANSRVVGPMIAGLLGGPFIGFLVGFIAGLHRFLIGGFTALSCGISTTIEGLIGGIIKKYYKNTVDWKIAFLAGIIGETLQMILILTISRPFSSALSLVKVIGLPMILVNSSGIAVFMLIIKSVFDEIDIIESRQAKIMLDITSKTIPYIRSGLNKDTAKVVSEIIYESINVDAVAITDRKTVLAYIGLDDVQDKCQFLKKAEINAFRFKKVYVENNKRGLGLLSSVTAPLYCYDELVGTLKLFRKNKFVNSTDIEVAKGLSNLISNQLEIADAENQKRIANEMKFNALQAQINPHFLFNALNTVISFIQYNPDGASKLLITLSEYLRNNLRYAGKWITIYKEIENIDAYLFIEKARFGDKINVAKDIDEDLLNMYIPALLIQPIVENAVKHGILPKDNGGTVTIKIKDNNDFIRFSVEDDGEGIDNEMLDRILRDGYGTNMGIGLHNVYERIQSIHRGAFFKIESKKGHGTKVIFDFPKYYEENKEEISSGVEVFNSR
ncbi:LytS/YhcK type 5TM receptor domain-containing protein [Thermoanaerobacterium thermosaccharolyticum]|uniref:LytS/YhcK type 5TM receptor domain-containing protein n=1 Tax=Thermoanaerobacterium thermosaccharolyticum TaxID=1517 RepID=UPI00177C923E|nr:LytS/YhcK type 5TM receptor domain-containing protein [Thermoanaerobacterium thermosaccharolyticum]MBE0069721.1 sensor histidine kinase [Thermoanaerobacterium thermosaccharolyticum]MBE0229447.1 sensor histidine kinase [Thermoanaerobacterium thermosaccharolyticum]